jgi:lipid II:glycine glycyltransferase (peptidoglycan interpeptide bridge formation enzyme)
MIQTKIIENVEIWEGMIDELEPHTFLQSWGWGEFNKNDKHEVYRFGFYRDENIVGIAQIIFLDAKRGAYFLCPHGPLVRKMDDYVECVSSLLDALKDLNEYKKCSFVRICPLLLNTNENADVFKGLGFKNAPIHQHPELSWMIDINREDDLILSDMRKTTRHAIRKGERDGVQIEISDKLEDLNKFWELYEETVKRQQFTPFSKSFLEQEFKVFKERNKVLLGLATYEGKVVSGAIIVFDNGGAYYHHGASLHTGKVPTSQLLQWRLIQQAKERGCKYYNFWGIAPPDKPKHPWAGLSVFKKGFGGFEESYVHAQDFVVSKKYWLNFVVESFRKWKRGL